MKLPGKTMAREAKPKLHIGRRSSHRFLDGLERLFIPILGLEQDK